MSQLPYRTALSGGEPSLLEGAEAEAFVNLVDNGGGRRVPEERARWVAQEGPETWAWMLSNRTTFVEGNRSQVHLDLLRRALADAEREGVLWSRILDRLAAVSSYDTSRDSSWDMLVKHLREKGASEVPPSPQEQAARLIPWVEAQSDPAAIEPIFKSFDAPALLSVIARHAVTLSPAQTEILRRRTPEALTSNPNLGAEARDELARKAMKEMLAEAAERQRHGHTSSSYGMTNKSRFVALLNGAEAVSEEVLLEMIDQVQGARNATLAWEFYPSLLSSPHLTEAVLERLADHAIHWEQTMLHPKMTADLRERLLARVPVEYISNALTKEGIAPHVNLAHLTRYVNELAGQEGGFVRARIAVLNHPLSTPEMWLRVLLPWNARERELMEAAANHPEVRKHPEIRPLLLKSRGTPVLTAMVEDAAPGEFLSLFLALYRKDPEAAGVALTRAQVPKGVKVPQDVMLALMQSSNAAVRLAAMTALGAAPTPADPAAAPAQQGGRSGR